MMSTPTAGRRLVFDFCRGVPYPEVWHRNSWIPRRFLWESSHRGIGYS